MSDVIRVFVEKKNGFDVEAQHIKSDLVENLGMEAIEELRLINRYDISGLSREEFAAARGTIFSEPNVDNVYDEEYPLPEGFCVFAMEYLPGQYDQRADSAAQYVQLLTQGERPQVITARVVAIKGDLSDVELDKIKSYMVNPVESRLASLEKPKTLNVEADVPADVARVNGFILWNTNRLFNEYGSS
jgi:phosphoribosylformylglycinamidine synthase